MITLPSPPAWRFISRSASSPCARSTSVGSRCTETRRSAMPDRGAFHPHRGRHPQTFRLAARSAGPSNRISPISIRSARGLLDEALDIPPTRDRAGDVVQSPRKRPASTPFSVPPASICRRDWRGRRSFDLVGPRPWKNIACTLRKAVACRNRSRSSVVAVLDALQYANSIGRRSQRGGCVSCASRRRVGRSRRCIGCHRWLQDVEQFFCQRVVQFLARLEPEAVRRAEVLAQIRPGSRDKHLRPLLRRRHRRCHARGRTAHDNHVDIVCDGDLSGGLVHRLAGGQADLREGEAQHG